MTKLSAVFTLLFASSVLAQADLARFGMKGGAFDSNGYDSRGFDVLGFDHSGNPAPSTVPDGKANSVLPVPASTSSDESSPTESPDVPKVKKAKKPKKPTIKPFATPTPVFTPVYTTFLTESSTIYVPVVETTVVFPIATVTKTSTVLFSIPLTTVNPFPEATESAHCFGGIVIFEVLGNALTDFRVEMYLSQVAYLAGAPSNAFHVVSWEYIAAGDTTKITTLTCNPLAYYDLLLATTENQGAFCQTTFPGVVAPLVQSPRIHRIAGRANKPVEGATVEVTFQGTPGSTEVIVLIPCV